MPIIFYSPSYKAALEAARAYAKTLLPAWPHPDYIELEEPYSKETIAQLLQESFLPPYQASSRILLFPKADTLLPVQANACLKTLEESPAHTQIVFVTDHLKGILETIRSRSKKIFVPAQEEAKELDALIATYLRKEEGHLRAFHKIDLALLAEERHIKPPVIMHYLQHQIDQS